MTTCGYDKEGNFCEYTELDNKRLMIVRRICMDFADEWVKKNLCDEGSYLSFVNALNKTLKADKDSLDWLLNICKLQDNIYASLIINYYNKESEPNLVDYYTHTQYDIVQRQKKLQPDNKCFL